MENEIDYSGYTLSELKEARSTIDEQAWPDRALILDQLIAAKEFASMSSPEPAAGAQQQGGAQDDAGQAVQPLRTVPVKFHGTTGEFFSIWIVNLALTIATLGIYSAWAKVRTNRYFYGNTDIDGHRFAYLAEPLQILKGRAIAVVLFGGYFLASYFNPLAGVIVAICLGLLTPVLVILSYRFKMRMTSYRNVRFNFKGRFGRAFVVFVLWPVASLFTLYLILPLALKKIDHFLLESTGYGDKSFKTRLNTGEYFGTGIAAGAIAFGIFMIGGIFMAVGIFSTSSGEEFSSSGSLVFTFGTFAMYFLAYVIASGFYSARIRNHLFAVTELDGIARFSSDVGVGELISLRGTNILAIIFTLGFAFPWTKVRTANFYAERTQVAVLSDVNKVMEGYTSDVGAAGEEAAGLFDVDIALG